MNKKALLTIFIFAITIILIIWCIFAVFGSSTEAVVSIFILIVVPVAGLVFRPIRDDIESSIDGFFTSENAYKICIFGRSGSGKTTFIETAFTLINPNTDRKSTLFFDYYQFKAQVTLKDSIDIEIADYRGQNPSQIILKAPEKFFGFEENRQLNALLFIVDLIPKRKDEYDHILNDEALLTWLKTDDPIEVIEKRIREHYEYINEGVLELLFSSLYSDKLKSVKLLINKTDLVNKLVDDGYVTLTSGSTVEEYARKRFQLMIKNISRACQELEIDDFSVLSISAKKPGTLNPIISDLLNKRS